MEREARSAKTKIIAGVGAILVLGLGVWGIGQQTHTKTTTTTKPVSASVVKAPTTYVKYQGVEGKTALELLKTHAKVQTKSSSLGDFVVSIISLIPSPSFRKYFFFTHRKIFLTNCLIVGK